MSATSVRERQRRETWRALQRSAIALVDQHGLDGVTVDDIAEQAGVSRRTFFNHFTTKAAALFDPDPEDADRLGRLLAEAGGPQVEPWAALRSVCVSFVAGHEDVLAVRRRLVAESPDLEQYHRTAHHHVEIALSDWARRRPGLDDFTADLIARTAAAILITAFDAWRPDSNPALLPGLVDRGFALAGDGLARPRLG